MSRVDSIPNVRTAATAILLLFCSGCGLGEGPRGSLCDSAATVLALDDAGDGVATLRVVVEGASRVLPDPAEHSLALIQAARVRSPAFVVRLSAPGFDDSTTSHAAGLGQLAEFHLEELLDRVPLDITATLNVHDASTNRESIDLAASFCLPVRPDTNEIVVEFGDAD